MYSYSDVENQIPCGYVVMEIKHVTSIIAVTCTTSDDKTGCGSCYS